MRLWRGFRAISTVVVLTLVPPPMVKAEGTPQEQARATGKRIEVAAERSESTTVYAEPDGTYTMELEARPVRARKGDTWVPVDPTLHRRAGGALAPQAVVLPLEFSGGGTESPLVRMTVAGKPLELRWPGSLPVPALSGDTAIYAEVLPGVDLRLTARPQGFGKVFVVKTPAAAKDPRLARIELVLSAPGLDIAVGGHGGLSVKDAAGAVLLESSAVQMWDSGGRSSVGQAILEQGKLSLVPDKGFLNDPQASYPLYVDPDFAAPAAGWTKVFSGKPGNSYYNGGGGDDALMKVGYCGWPGCNGIGSTRTFAQFRIAALRGAQILAAEFNIHEVYAPSCSARVMDVYSTYPIGAGTTWNVQPGGWVAVGSRNVALGYSSSCPENWVGFNARPTVIRRLDEGSDFATFAIRADDELDAYGWKKFNAVRLIVSYNWLPDVPSGRYANVGQGPSLGCATAVNTAYAYSPRPTLRARLTDRDGQNLSANFEWFRAGGAKVGGVVTAAQPNGTVHAATVPAGAFANGGQIQWRVQARDSTGAWGPFSGWCHLTVDSTPPGRPGVTSTDYPRDAVGGYIGKTGAFTVTTTDPDVIGYQWSLNFQDLPAVDVNSPFFMRTTNGTATIRVTPNRDGPNDLYVRAVDKALNVSAADGYHFLVSSAVPKPAVDWPVDGYGITTSVPDFSGRGNHGTVTGAKAWITGRSGDALDFDGTTGHAATSAAVINTSGTFTVAAWARLDKLGGRPAVVSQDGSHSPGFQVQATPEGKWAFAMFASDVDGGGTRHDRVASTAAVKVGVWTHLAATFDSSTGQMRLYVNGALAASGTHPAPWHAGGPFTIGRSRWNSAPADFFPGGIDSVVAHQRLLTEGEIQTLANGPAVEEAFYPLEEGELTRANDLSGNYRTGTLTGGTWVEAPGGTSAVELNGTNGFISTAAQAVRTDGSFTVTARALLGAAGNVSQAVVSQDGSGASGFALQYIYETKKWAFMVAPTDTASPAWIKAESAAPAVAGQWVHLAGVYDAALGQVRLYVDGAEHIAAGRVTGHVPGNLIIGRAKSGGVVKNFFGGRIDDVHVYTGVRTKDEIVADMLTQVTARPTVYSGQLSRYVGPNGLNHFATTGPVPPGFRYEFSLGMMAPPGTAGTQMVYSCTHPQGQFVSLSPDCEGKTMLGEIGLLYTDPPPATVPTVPIYRCVVLGSGDHFISNTSDCAGFQMEGLLGHAAAYRRLIRFVKQFSPHDHMAGVSTPPQGYLSEGAQGLLAMTSEPGVRGLYACVDGTDEFVSTDAACAGKQVRYWIGGIWTSPPSYAESTAPLYACVITTTGERFTSFDEFCEGQTAAGRIGYVIINLPGVQE